MALTHRGVLPSAWILAAFTLVLLSASLARTQPRKGGPLKPQDALQALKVADGFQVELFAAEPDLINPTSIDVDHKGRVWVAEAVNYRRKGFGRPIIRKEGDRIQVLVDAKGEGKATKAVTFYQSPEIYGPIGICIAPYPDGKGQKVFICQSPDILVLEDRDGDLKADGPPKKFLTGFRGFDHDHGVHGINIGPDGKLYFTVGDAGVGGLQSSDGKGRKWTSNTTDVQKGTVWRCDMDGKNLELIAHNFRNNYECCVDSFGEIWLSDNDDDGNQQTRICFVMPGGNYGYGPRGPGQSHWHEEQPGIVHKTLRTGFGSPTGITFYEGTLFPKKYIGALLHCDAGPREVRWFFRKPKGAGYELDKEILLTSSDNWFRPSDVCVAPDGSIFVADWYDRGVGGHGMGDPTDGRIYRITPKGHKGYKVPEVKLDTKEGVLAALGSPCQATRAQVIKALKAWDHAPFFDLCLPLLAPGAPISPTLRARAEWVIFRHQMEVTPERLSAYSRVQAGGPDDRALLARAFDEAVGGAPFSMSAVLIRKLAAPEKWQTTNLSEDVIRLVLRLDPMSPRSIPYERELLLLSRKAALSPDLITLFYILAQKYDGHDIFYRAALNIACGTDPKRRDAILADFDKHFPEWNDKVADLVWELRPKSVLPRLGKLLADPKLLIPQQKRILDIMMNVDSADTAVKVLSLYRNDRTHIGTRRMLFEVLRDNLPGRFNSLTKNADLSAAIDNALKNANREWREQAIVLAGVAKLVRFAPDLRGIAGSEVDDYLARHAAIRGLGQFKGASDVKLLNRIARDDANIGLRKLSVKVLGDMQTKESLAALEALFLAKKTRGDVQLEILSALVGSRAGTQWLLATHQEGKLPKDLVADAGRLLRNSPFQGERNKALLLFPAPGKLNPKSLPAIAVLARRTGDAARGKAVWNASATGAAQCAKCHMVRGVGGQVGPDLSMVGKKSAREALYESILAPSRAIADQYIQQSVTTTAEVTVSGLLIAESPESITLRDANGKDTTIPRKEIEGQIRKLKTSIMPEDIVAGLNEDELVDLVAYLETLKLASLTPDNFQLIGPFHAASMEKALDTEYGPEKKPFDLRGRFPTAKVELGWRTIRPDGKGYFDLAALHGVGANNSASYMYAEIDSPSEQAGEVLLGPDDGVRLWVNGKEVFVVRETKAATPEAHKVPVKLRKGTNTVLLKVANGDGPHGFYFSITSPEETKLVPKK